MPSSQNNNKLTWLEPAIQSKTSAFKITWLLNLKLRWSAAEYWPSRFRGQKIFCRYSSRLKRTIVLAYTREVISESDQKEAIRNRLNFKPLTSWVENTQTPRNMRETINKIPMLQNKFTVQTKFSFSLERTRRLTVLPAFCSWNR